MQSRILIWVYFIILFNLKYIRNIYFIFFLKKKETFMCRNTKIKNHCAHSLVLVLIRFVIIKNPDKKFFIDK